MLGGVSVGAMIYSFVKWSGSRNITTLDNNIKELTTSTRDLSESVQRLREADIAIAKDVGALQSLCESLKERIEGQSAYQALLKSQRRR